MPYNFHLIRRTTVRRVLTFKNPPPPKGNGLPQDLRGCSFTLFVSSNGTETQIDGSGTDQKLIYNDVSLQNGQITFYVSEARLETWPRCRWLPYWLRMTDSVGDAKRRLAGQIIVRDATDV